MTTVAELAAWMEEIAPTSLAEDWDNVGLLWGDPASDIDRVMTCLTVTPEVAAEAIEGGAGVIVSHHPILFRAVRKVRGDDPDGAMLLSLAKSGIAVISHHTAYDNAEGGMNDLLAHRLGLVEVGPLKESSGPAEFKVIVFAPEEARNAILNAAFEAGAGRIGDYRECSFATRGIGTFFGAEGTNPAVGQPGRREAVEEARIEILTPGRSLDTVIAAIRSAHPYEEPAIDVIPLQRTHRGPGIGRVGRLPNPLSVDEFAGLVAGLLDSPSTQYAGSADLVVRRVAIACGAGDGFLGDAAKSADVLLTGEARFHRGLEARARGIGLVVAGHHATERPGVEDLAERIGRRFPSVAAWASLREADPFRKGGG